MKPPTTLKVRTGYVLRRYRIKDAEALAAAVTANVDHLIPWMDWASLEPVSLTARRELLRTWKREWASGESYQYGLFNTKGLVIGAAGLVRRVGPGRIEIGYWLASSHTGRGLATLATEALTDAAEPAS